MMHEIGERVGAILGSNKDTVEFLGYGIYTGDFDYENPDNAPKAVGSIADMMREAKKYADEHKIEYFLLNPRILLDSGKIVWGCECWWGSEDVIKKRLENAVSKGMKIKEVDIDVIRTSLSKNEKDE